MAATAAERWAKARTFHHSRYPAQRIAAERGERAVSVCLPARECAQTVGQIVGALVGLREAGAIDEVVVIDAALARRHREVGAARGRDRAARRRS